MSSEQLIRLLVDRDDGPWPRWWARDVAAGEFRGPAARLAKMLRQFEIRPKQLWIDGHNQRGYEAAMFAKAWERYLRSWDTPPTTPRTLDVRAEMASDQGTSDLASFWRGVPN